MGIYIYIYIKQDTLIIIWGLCTATGCDNWLIICRSYVEVRMQVQVLMQVKCHMMQKYGKFRRKITILAKVCKTGQKIVKNTKVFCSIN